MSINLASIQTPGVYINEVNAFPNSVVPVATAVPAFIGYTPDQTYQGKSYLNTPVSVSSWAEFLAYFGKKDPADPTGATMLPAGEQYVPVYHVVPAPSPAQPAISLGGQPLGLAPDPATITYLYSSVQLFFLNGGGTCYIVSVGTHGPASGQPLPAGEPLVNPNVTLASLKLGIAALVSVPGVTLVLAPDAVLLSASDYAEYCQAVIGHCSEAQSRMAILDVQKGAQPDPQTWPDDIAAFRNAVGMNGLSYGAAYYPFLKTGIVAIDYRNIASPAETLGQYLPGAGSAPLSGIIASMGASQAASPAEITRALLTASADYGQLINALTAIAGVLPPSGAMAGIYTMVDNTRGVWKAPANIIPAGVSDVTRRLTSAEQDTLNVDATTGKSINALRFFTGQGVLVWGARTLDGNSSDWRYIPVRRTAIYLEQSIKLALQQYVFAPNTPITWATVKSALSSFLTSQWQAGALMGSTASDAFSVSVGLGTTMTADDLLNNVMNVSVQVAIVRPAEFIAMNFVQQMAGPTG